MEEQQDISNQKPSVGNNAAHSDFIVVTTDSSPKKLSFFPLFYIIVIIVFFSLGGLISLFFSGKTEKQHILQPAVIAIVTTHVTPIPTQSVEVTQLTKIATSLDVPTLYRNWQWSSEINPLNNDELTSITVDRYDQNYLTVPMKGKAYTATSSAITNPDDRFIDNYYAILLQKSGWLVDGASPYLEFRSFRLRANIADSSCGGLDGYLGYKDGMVRLVSVEHTMQPCIPPIGLQNGKVVTQNIAYTVFIGNSVSLQYFNEYMATHPK
jgi:hypothetical protein